ncbi:TraR/DksA family transcriptional regulator [Dyella caseinilytica]|uniref:TraR/DksA family transcriptional regulator n=1 Tax=Dyella caseinilytica TaxID=1849581 RepID=A0ABX7GQZ1_9GAMM|nr:TraR/DksA family transcriptional regulator [Dyella caseinilytica]QRN52413.1 TraR/DksA family transcriptional regulator [Dyella caseinilytica]GGA05771.1 hypothetical protein GCM10011408_28390 [Dyella caseinilytica]
MADEADQAQVVEEMHIRAALANHAARIAKVSSVVPMCEECEEYPAAVLSNGVRGKHCTRCAEELTASKAA